MKPPAARSRTSVSLMSAASKSKSARSLASGSLATVIWQLMDRALGGRKVRRTLRRSASLSSISAFGRSPTTWLAARAGASPPWPERRHRRCACRCAGRARSTHGARDGRLRCDALQLAHGGENVGAFHQRAPLRPPSRARSATGSRFSRSASGVAIVGGGPLSRLRARMLSTTSAERTPCSNASAQAAATRPAARRSAPRRGSAPSAGRRPTPPSACAGCSGSRPVAPSLRAGRH